MSRQLQDIFEECVERLRQGDSIENCLNSYPEVAADLEVLLRTSLNVNWRASMVQPRPEFKARARAQFIGAQQYAAQLKEVRPRPTIFSLQRAWVPALAVVLLLIFSSVGTAAAASNAMPDEPLYPAKIATEQVQLAFALSNEAKAELNVKLAETRSQEIATMATQGKTEQVVATTERLSQNLNAAEIAIQNIERTEIRQTLSVPQESTITPSAQPEPIMPPAPAPAPPRPDNSEKPQDTTRAAGKEPGLSWEKASTDKVERLRQSLNAIISKNVVILENAKNVAPDQTKQAIQEAIDISNSKQIELQNQRPEMQPKPLENNGNSKGFTPEPTGNKDEGQRPLPQSTGNENEETQTPEKSESITTTDPNKTSTTRDTSENIDKSLTSTTDNTSSTDTTKR